MADSLLIYRNSTAGIPHKITDNISINHPTLSEICEIGEQNYYSMTSILCANSSQHKVFLWDNGVDWTQISDYDFFFWIYKQFTLESTKVILGDLDLSSLRIYVNQQTNENVLGIEVNGEVKIIIDRAIYTELVDYIRKMHGFDPKEDKPSNEHTKKYMIERERKKIARQQQKKDEQKPVLQPLISALVNNSNFKYDYTTVWDITISALTDSVSRIQKLMNYLQTMQGIYSGCIDYSKIVDKEALNWMN